MMILLILFLYCFLAFIGARIYDNKTNQKYRIEELTLLSLMWPLFLFAFTAFKIGDSISWLFKIKKKSKNGSK